MSATEKNVKEGQEEMFVNKKEERRKTNVFIIEIIQNVTLDDKEATAPGLHVAHALLALLEKPAFGAHERVDLYPFHPSCFVFCVFSEHVFRFCVFDQKREERRKRGSDHRVGELGCAVHQGLDQIGGGGHKGIDPTGNVSGILGAKVVGSVGCDELHAVWSHLLGGNQVTRDQ